MYLYKRAGAKSSFTALYDCIKSVKQQAAIKTAFHMLWLIQVSNAMQIQNIWKTHER